VRKVRPRVPSPLRSRARHRVSLLRRPHHARPRPTTPNTPRLQIDIHNSHSSMYVTSTTSSTSPSLHDKLAQAAHVVRRAEA